jgi:hypothetical protein
MIRGCRCHGRPRQYDAAVRQGFLEQDQYERLLEELPKNH